MICIALVIIEGSLDSVHDVVFCNQESKASESAKKAAVCTMHIIHFEKIVTNLP